MNQGHYCWIDSYLHDLFVCTCTDEEYASYPPLEFQIDGTTYTMTRENYIDRTFNICMFKVMYMDLSHQDPFWIMGLTFFHNYYTVFDQQNSRIGFAQSKLSNLPLPEPVNEVEEEIITIGNETFLNTTEAPEVVVCDSNLTAFNGSGEASSLIVLPEADQN
jgi:hypothetical protein